MVQYTTFEHIPVVFPNVFSTISFNNIVDPYYAVLSPKWLARSWELFTLNPLSLKHLCHLITSLLEHFTKPRSINFRVSVGVILVVAQCLIM